MIRRSLLATAVSLALFTQVSAQQTNPAPTTQGGSVPVTYIGPDGRVSAGIDHDGNFTGEFLWALGAKKNSSWLLDGWLGYGGAAGLKFGYHWLWGGDSETAIKSPEKLKVGKVFVAADQNLFDDRKVTAGFGIEKNDLFFDAYLSKSVTDERFISSSSRGIAQVLTGTDAGRPYRQTQTTTTVTSTFEHPYDRGIGVRGGRYFDGQLVRLRGGLDYEEGDFSSHQTTVSLGVDKLINNSPHSFSLQLEHLNKSGAFELVDSDTRAWLLWRYDLGQNFRAREPFKQVETVRQQEVVTQGEPVIVRNEIRVDGDAFFRLDRAELTDVAKQALTELAEAMKSEKRISRISVSGHTCDLGSDTYNADLSKRRAGSVRDFLAALNVDAAEMDVFGKGEAEPKFPNDGEANRQKNRRVDLSFLSVEESREAPAPVTTTKDVVEWVKEPVELPAAWVERALRNPSQHKRTVDVYRYQTDDVNVTLGVREFINRAPIAVNDTLTVPSNSAATVINVLANDSDPDGDALSITANTNAANGTVTRTGNTISYRPNAGYVGSDSFTYTISDGKGGTAIGTVTITVTQANRAPIAVDDIGTVPNSLAPIIINVLANDSDPDGDPITLVSIDTTNSPKANVFMNPNGTVTFAPYANWCFSGSFTYVIRDPAGLTATATVNVRLIAPNPESLNKCVIVQ